MISIIGLFWLSGCDSPSSDSGNTESKAEAEAQNGLIYKSSMKLLYAKNFSVDYYEGGYKILTTKDGTKILTVPKGKKTPKDIDKDIIGSVLDGFDGVPGRFQLVEAGQPYTVIVDYAHTPDGLENVLKTARSITRGKL